MADHHCSWCDDQPRATEDVAARLDAIAARVEHNHEYGDFHGLAAEIPWLVELLRTRDAAIRKAREKAERWIRDVPDTDWAKAGTNILDAFGEDVEARADGAPPSGLGIEGGA